MTPYTKDELEAMHNSLIKAIYRVESDYNSELEDREDICDTLNNLDNIEILLIHLIKQSN
jgi:hypothetical protein